MLTFWQILLGECWRRLCWRWARGCWRTAACPQGWTPETGCTLQSLYRRGQREGEFMYKCNGLKGEPERGRESYSTYLFQWNQDQVGCQGQFVTFLEKRRHFIIQHLILLSEFFFLNQFSFCLYVPIFRRSSTDCSTNLLILYDLLIKKCIQMYILCVINWLRLRKVDWLCKELDLIKIQF